MLVGTPDYMSPEQARGKELDPRTDIYSVGVIIYEMLVGQVPFEADSFVRVLAMHMHELPEPPSRAAPGSGIPPQAEAIVLCAMAKDRDQRYASMPAMAAAIASAPGRGTRPTQPLPEASQLPGSGDPGADDLTLPVPRRRRGRRGLWGRWVLLLLGALVLAALLAVAVRLLS
jgi:serine/threonine-protein kinase